MKRISNFLILVVTLIAINLESCQTCDNCEIAPAPKQVRVLDSGGDDLIFGSSSLYNPDNIVIKNNLGQTVEFFANKNNGSLDFTFSTAADTYNIALNSSTTEKIKFTYGKDKHIDCCNEFDVTKTTTVNGNPVSNDDKIIIVK